MHHHFPVVKIPLRALQFKNPERIKNASLSGPSDIIASDSGYQSIRLLSLGFESSLLFFILLKIKATFASTRCEPVDINRL